MTLSLFILKTAAAFVALLLGGLLFSCISNCIAGKGFQPAAGPMKLWGIAAVAWVGFYGGLSYLGIEYLPASTIAIVGAVSIPYFILMHQNPLLWRKGNVRSSTGSSSGEQNGEEGG